MGGDVRASSVVVGNVRGVGLCIVVPGLVDKVCLEVVGLDKGEVVEIVGGNVVESKANFVVVSSPWSNQAVRIFFGGGRERDGKKLWNGFIR